MALEFGGLGALKNNLLRQFLSEFVEMRFLYRDKSTINNSYRKSGSVTSNFYLKEFNNEHGDKEEIIFFSPASERDNNLVINSSVLELIRKDGSFVRYNYTEGKTKPRPPLMQWRLVVKPNENDFNVVD